MDINEFQGITTTGITALSAILAVAQYIWNSRPHYSLLKDIRSYSIGEPKDNLTISISNYGETKINASLKGITFEKEAGAGKKFKRVINFPKKMTCFKTFEPHEVGVLIEFTSQSFYNLISYKCNSYFSKAVKKRIINNEPISFYVWILDYKNHKSPILVNIEPQTDFYQNFKKLVLN